MGCTDRSVLRPLLGGSESSRRQVRQNNNNNEFDLTSKTCQKFGNMGDHHSIDSMSRTAVISRRILLLVWKNFLFRKRHYVVTALEIVLPTLFAIVLAFMKAKLPPELNELKSGKQVSNVTIFPEMTELNLIEFLDRQISCSQCVIAYCPQTTLTHHVIDKLSLILNGTATEWRGFNTELEIEAFRGHSGITNEIHLKAAIVFESGFTSDFDDVDKQQKLSYKLRFPDNLESTNLLFPLFQLPGPNILIFVECLLAMACCCLVLIFINLNIQGILIRTESALVYPMAGFSGLQILLDKIIISLLSNQRMIEERITLQPFPYPPYLQNFDFAQVFNLFMPMLLALGFVFIVPSVIRGVVGEKETGIKELMKMMGLPNWMHWLGWMLNSLMVLAVSISIVVFLFFYPFTPANGSVIEHSDPSLFWIVLFLYAITSTALCFFISSFFQRPTLATTAGIVVWLISYFGLATNLEQRYQYMHMEEKLLVCLIPNMALTYFIKVLAGFEGKAVGAHWKNLFEPTSSIDSLTIAHIMLMMVLSSAVYISLTLYVENVLPSEYGVRKPWYYIFKLSTWYSSKVSNSNSVISRSNTNESKEGFESDPSGFSPGVEIYNLRKEFGSKKVAVDGVTLKMFDGQITALLGHNGAGKTTTMSMLTGMFAPTSGTAVVNGHNIITNMEGVRRDLGLCPQHNMLFDKLTVAEHLQFFGRLKGLSSSQSNIEMKTLIKKLQLTEKINNLAMTLSGGQKRKLNLGIALIGGTKVVILDEPTSGMDPEARRVIWDLLLEMRGERTIVLTTHFMEEADVLGDRIAIMAAGKVKCYGSPMFLKRFYGAGYTLSMTLEPSGRSDLILLTVKKYIENATFKSQHIRNSSEVAFTLPTGSDTTSKFPHMFSELSQKKNDLGIRTIGLSLTTMDEVFVKVDYLNHDKDNDEIDDSARQENSVVLNEDGLSRLSNSLASRMVGLRLQKQQFCALFVKKYLYTLRKRRLFISQFVMPVFLLIVAIWTSNSAFEPTSSSPPLKLNISSYKNPITLYSASEEGIGKLYASSVGNSALKSVSDANIIDALTSIGETDLSSFREQYIVAADLNSSYVKAMFSTIPYHAAPLAINLASNTILKKLNPTKNHFIEVTTHPFSIDSHAIDATSEIPGFSQTIPILFAVFLPIGLALLAASFIVFPVEERLCKAKQLQLMTGVSPLIFWSSSFVWDFFLMILVVCVMICCFPIFQTYGTFTAYGGAGVLFLILLVYGFAAISFSYLCSLIVSTVAGGFSLVSVVHVFSGMVVCIIVFTLEVSGFFSQANGIRQFARIFPTFGAAISTMRFTEIATLNGRCNILSDTVKLALCNPNNTLPLNSRSCCDNCKTDFPSATCFEPQPYILWSEFKNSPFHTGDTQAEVPGIGQEVFYMFLIGVFFKFVLILIEYGVIKKLVHAIISKTSSVLQRIAVDEDVTAENDRIQDLINSGKVFEDSIVVNNLCKSYGTFAAVSNITFGVHHGECFGLLGVNGAGKTTTFRMLTGDEISSCGFAHTAMCSLHSDRKRFLSNIGYCPQFDGIVGVLTGKEMLELFCRLRGVQAASIHAEATQWLAKLGLVESASVQCIKYSGGMKRRLSTAMALVGDPPVVLLDEPTSGVDPVARRQFWKAISSVRDSGQAIILTSHSMEECEALCSRLAIMVNGQLQCMGGVQHLKNKFAQGYSLIIKLKSMIPPTSPELATLTAIIEDVFDPCNLKDRHQNLLHYHLLNTALPWNVLFKTIEDLKQRFEHIIEDYSINETTLEEVFLSFARKQYPNRLANTPLCERLVSCQCFH